ncbi:hypothetical protein TWF730_010126 [Orbilia blumenaviensis]|uniref:Uncharacterized protein n=1 Tax=Orbilia blumenaviensis TaxID=1796055 RepID=A0AAV9URZ6_9PEZI
MAATFAQAEAALKHVNQGFKAAPKLQLSEEEQKKANIAKAHTIQTMEEIESLITEALARSTEKTEAARKRAAANKVILATTDDVNTAFKQASETNLSSVATTSAAMSTSISNVTTDFTSILNLSNIEAFSGLLNNVPAVGISNSAVQFVNDTLDSSGNIQQSWSKLDDLPETPAAGDTVSVFSYNGIVYVAIGANLWSKTQLDNSDPQIIKAATDSWAKGFSSGWVSLGSCLGENNASCFIPYTSVSSDGTSMTNWLIKLSANGALSYTTGTLSTTTSFSSLSASGQAVNLLKAAYWNNSIWGYDATNTLYQISITAGAGGTTLSNYQITSQQALSDPITDFTAVDTGLVAARQDGNLWKLITYPPASADAQPTQAWTQWIPQDGVTNLGAVSVGMILDLRTLTTLLSDTYLNIQTSLLQYVNLIQAFCSSHGVYLASLAQDATEYNSASSTAQQKEIAVQAGQTALQHCQAWGNLLSTSLNQADSIVKGMTGQLSDIQLSINTQLASIKTQISDLKSTLTTDQELHTIYTDELWASAGAVLLGIGILLASEFFPAIGILSLSVAGAMIVGGCIGIIILACEITSLDNAMTNIKTNIANLKTAHQQLTDISGKFGDLLTDYGNLDAFWGNLKDICAQIQFQELELTMLGTGLLTDPSTITAAQQNIQTIETNLKEYLAILNSQGVSSPSQPSFAKLPEHLHKISDSDLHNLVTSVEPNEKVWGQVNLEIALRMLKEAHAKYTQGDIISNYIFGVNGSSLFTVSLFLVIDDYRRKTFQQTAVSVS